VIVKRIHPDGRTVRASEMFVGPHDYQSIVGKESAQFRVAELTFRDGARTRLHVHDSEQLIIIVTGAGVCGTVDAEHDMGVGDHALIAAGEAHWHGVRANGEVTLLSVLGPHTTRLAEV